MAMTSMTDQGAGQPRARDGQRAKPPSDQGGMLVARLRGAREQPLTPDEVAKVTSFAARAPSVHNTQPWKFRPHRGSIELLGDPDRMLRTVDPRGRELIMSCGAALFGLRLGLRSLGRLPAVELQPDLGEPWLMARVSSAGHAARAGAESELIAAVPHRHTHRGPFAPGEVPARLLSAMVTDAAAEGCELQIIKDPRVIARLDRLVRGAAARQSSRAEITAELGHWVRPLGSVARDGVPARARLADSVGWEGGTEGAALQARLAPRDFGQPGTEDLGGAPPSATAVLLTAGDTPADWLRAGQALDRALLRAAARWVFASLQSQPLESPRHRRAVQALLGGIGFPQMIMQLGRANIAAATPRRPHSEMLVTELD
jgi:hypothetical protein